MKHQWAKRGHRISENAAPVKIGPTSRGTALDTSLADDRALENMFVVPVQQCATCMAPVKSLCTCEADEKRAAKAAQREADREAGKIASSAPKVQRVKRQVTSRSDAARVQAEFEEAVLRHAEKLTELPVTMIQTYLASLSPKMRVAVIALA